MSQNRVIVVYEDHFINLVQESLKNASEPFDLSVRLVAPSDVQKVGYGLFLRISDTLLARAKYVYPTRAKALAKLADILPLEVTAIAVTPYGGVGQGNGEP